MSRIVTYETEAGAGIMAAGQGSGDETPLLVLGGPARGPLRHMAGRMPAGVAVMSVEASSERVRLTRVIVSSLTQRGNGRVGARIEALDREDAQPEKGFSTPLQEAVFLLLLRPRVLKVRPAKRHLGPLMQDLAKRLEVLLGMKLRPPRVVVLSPGPSAAAAEQSEIEAEGPQIGPREIYREVLARVRAALRAMASAQG